MFFVSNNLTSSIPSSFNADELQRLMEQAKRRDIDPSCECDPSHDFSEEHLTQLASDICDEAIDRSHGPMIHKVIVLTILSRMIDWHTQIGEKLIEEGEINSAVNWIRDAGKLQACMSQMLEVQLGDDDFTCD
jgi:hypothetical protein